MGLAVRHPGHERFERLAVKKLPDRIGIHVSASSLCTAVQYGEPPASRSRPLEARGFRVFAIGKPRES